VALDVRAQDRVGCTNSIGSGRNTVFMNKLAKSIPPTDVS
jgi:hypothetical protein